MPAPSKKRLLWSRVVEMADRGMTQPEIGQVLDVHPFTISKWAREEDYPWPQKPGGAPRKDRVDKTCERDGCENHFLVYGHQASFRRFCSRECTNAWQREEASAARISLTCVCGKEFTVDPSQVERGRQFCSKSCANRHQAKRQADPALQVTFTCETCGTEHTRRRRKGQPWRFCSNACAAKHTKTVKHYVVREMDMVLDSTWEMLFAGLCGFFKIPIVRTDRSLAVMAEDGTTYAPDFIVSLPSGAVAVEVKGWDSGAQHEGWQAWIEQMGTLIVVDHHLLDLLRTATDGTFEGALLRGAVAESSLS